MQVVEADSIGVMELLVSISQSNDDPGKMYSHVAQQIWRGNYRDYTSSQMFDIDATEADYQSEADYSGGTPMSSTPWTTTRWMCSNCRPADATLTMKDSLQCTSVTLTRVAGSQGGIFPPPPPVPSSGGGSSGGGDGSGGDSGCSAFDSSIGASHPVQESCRTFAQEYSVASSGCGTQWSDMWIPCTTQCCSRRRSLTAINTNHANASVDFLLRSCKINPGASKVDVCPDDEEGQHEVKMLTVCSDLMAQVNDVQHEERAILIIVSVIAAAFLMWVVALVMLIHRGKSRARQLSVRLGALELQEVKTKKLIDTPF
jgi:hypothetical protein